MSSEFTTPDYEAILNSTVTLRDAIPVNHLARFVVDVITQLDLRPIYARYAPVGGVAIAPEILLGCFFTVMPRAHLVRASWRAPPQKTLPSAMSPAVCIPTTTRLPTFARRSPPEIQELFV